MRKLIYILVLILFSCNSKENQIQTANNSELAIINGDNTSLYIDTNLKHLIPKAHLETIYFKPKINKHPILSFISAILLIIISIVHFIYGEKKQIPDLKKITADSIMIGSLRIMIIQGGFVILFAGIIQMLVALDVIVLGGIARYFPLSLVLINFVVALSTTLLMHREIFKITLPQFVIFGVIFVLQILALN